MMLYTVGSYHPVRIIIVMETFKYTQHYNALNNTHKSMVLDQLSDPQHSELGSVREILLSKHPPPGLIDPSAIHLDRSNPVHYPHSIVFDNITGDLIKKMALKCQGAAGPSGLDATSWRRLCSSFKSASSNLCHSLALVARRLCTAFVDPDNLSAFVACRLIALNKNPGVRPIGVGETCRRIISKAIHSPGFRCH